MSRTQDFTFSKKYISGQDRKNHVPGLMEYRNWLSGRFNKQISLLMESKRPRKQFSNKGRLDPRRAYRFPFSDNIFSRYDHIPSSDTTFVFMIDGSGSMDSGAVAFGDHWLSKMDVSNAVCSAFGKSVRDVLNDELKVEVFVKSAPCLRTEDNFLKGDFVSLTRVFTNSRHQDNLTYDKLLKVSTMSPIELTDNESDNNGMGSATAEYSVLPGLMRWMKKNIATKNVVVINISDGETYCSVGKNYQFRDEDTATLFTKYLRGVPNMTLLVGHGREEKHSGMYGSNVVYSERGNFDVSLFKVLMVLLNESYQ